MRALALVLALAACTTAPGGPIPQSAGLTPDARGLQPAGTALRLDFGRAEPGVTVTDDEVRRAQRWAFANLRLVIEPGGAAALAAALAGKVPLDEGTVIMVTGGNADPARFAATIAEGR